MFCWLAQSQKLHARDRPCEAASDLLVAQPRLAGEILVVWNRGEPPHPRAAFDSAVPVRVRVEPRNSMNNRFKPDAGIKFRWGRWA